MVKRDSIRKKLIETKFLVVNHTLVCLATFLAIKLCITDATIF